jgi:hypothetical protein
VLGRARPALMEPARQRQPDKQRSDCQSVPLRADALLLAASWLRGLGNQGARLETDETLVYERDLFCCGSAGRAAGCGRLVLAERARRRSSS